MLYRHVFDKISTEFGGIFRVFVNFADLLEFCGSMTTQNIRNPVYFIQINMPSITTLL